MKAKRGSLLPRLGDINDIRESACRFALHRFCGHQSAFSQPIHVRGKAQEVKQLVVPRILNELPGLPPLHRGLAYLCDLRELGTRETIP